MRATTSKALVALFCGALLACGGGAPERAPAEPVRVENPALGFAIAALYQPFEVEVNEGETLRLSAPGGTVDFTVGEQDPHVNLVEAVRQRRAAFEALPGGRYFGNRELGTPNGPAYTSRGAYDTDSGRVEETWVLALHPSGDRLLTLTYRYPPGEASERVPRLLEVLGEIEGLGEAPERPVE